MTPKQLRQTLEQSLQQQNQPEYKRMKVSGRLEPYLESLMGEYEQSVEAGRQSALDSLASSDSPEKVPQLNSLFAEIEETALSQVIERMQATTASSRAS